MMATIQAEFGSVGSMGEKACTDNIDQAPRRPTISQSDKFWGVCSEQNYLNRLQQKASSVGSESLLSPADREESCYKLYVSLHGDDYVKHAEDINRIITSHLEQGAINRFKFVDNGAISQKIIQSRKVIDNCKTCWGKLDDDEGGIDMAFLSRLDADLTSDEDTNFSWNDNLVTPLFQKIENSIRTLESRIKKLEQLQSTGQIVIDIPENMDENKILNLCKDIDNYLKTSYSVSATPINTEASVGGYLYLHQTTENSVVDQDLSADSGSDGSDDAQMQVGSKAVESNLYKYLSRHF